jgi:putative chitinase
MFVNADQLARLAPGIDPARARDLATELNIGLPLFGASGFLARCHFLAQACHESAGFTRFEENLHYTHAAAISNCWPRLAGRAADLCNAPQALANAAYALHNGNGDEASGDGWRYRGRGIFQLTGRANYAAAGKDLKADLVGHPDLLLQTRFAVDSALWFFKAHRCIEAAARDDVDEVTAAINGSRKEGLDQRRQLTERAKQILGQGAIT